MHLHDWARDWNVSLDALADLRRRLTGETPETARVAGVSLSESAVSNLVRQEASQKGLRLFRNNVGGCYDASGNFIRYGLANDSAQLNSKIKSGDLIGIRPVRITPAHVGVTLGQFVSREVKHAGWHYTGDAREMAQKTWADFINSFGGDAGFCNGVGTL